MMPAEAPQTGAIQINIVDGTRQAIAADRDLLLRILDGRHQQIVAPWVSGPRIRVTDLPYHDNLDDRYTVFVHSKGYGDGAVYPVLLKRGATVDTNIMLLPDDGEFHFRKWTDLQGADARLLQLVTNGAENPAERYTDTLESKPRQLGSLLTLGTAVRDITLDDSTSPLSYY